MREELKCVSVESGEVCVTVVGIDKRLKLCVVNWDTIHHVREIYKINVHEHICYHTRAGATYYHTSRFGDGILPMLAESFSCSGTENNLLSCGGTTGFSTCYHGRAAGVRCFSK